MNSVIVIFKDNSFSLYSWEFFEKNILGRSKWMLRLTSLEDMNQPEKHVYAEGDASVIIDELKRNGTWGTWIITEVKEMEGTENILSSFGFEPKEYVIKVKDIA